MVPLLASTALGIAVFLWQSRQVEAQGDSFIEKLTDAFRRRAPGTQQSRLGGAASEVVNVGETPPANQAQTAIAPAPGATEPETVVSIQPIGEPIPLETDRRGRPIRTLPAVSRRAVER